MDTILIIDDDDHLRKSFERLLTEEGYTVKSAPSGEAGLKMVHAKVPDLVILDVRLPGMNGLQTFKAIHEIEPKLPVIIMTAYGTTETAIEATKMGAFDYILKPFDIPDMLSQIKQALEAGRFMRSPVDMNTDPELSSREALIGRSKPMQDVYKAIGRVSSTDATILIRGESGTGKELVARAIYHHSLRAGKPFLVINCVAIPETLLESELFGYEKGAFTGASFRRVGKIEQANQGTVFLDEIGDMPFSIQSKILRLLQERSIERLGGRDTIDVDVRILAATNRDLEKALSEGRFREDLYYRLKVVTIWLPPLQGKRRRHPPSGGVFSLPLCCRNGHAQSRAHQGKRFPFSSHYPWPGNVRELANTIQKALIFNRGMPISPEIISQAISGHAPGPATGGEGADDSIRQWVRDKILSGPEEDLFEKCVDRFARILISEALTITGGNRSQVRKTPRPVQAHPSLQD